MNDKKTGLSLQQRRIKKFFANKAPSAYFPQLNIIFGYQLGLLLNQLAWWEGKQRTQGGWIYKTVKELHKETGLTASNQKYAIELGKALGFLEVRHFQVPRKRHYRVSWNKVFEIAEVRAKKGEVDITKHILELSDNRRTNTKNTQKNTPKKNSSPSHIGNMLNGYIEKIMNRRGKNED